MGVKTVSYSEGETNVG